MRLLVFGQTGQVARELARRAPEATYLGRSEADLSDPAACAAAIKQHRPDAVINAAAWTAVDKAESDEAAATIVNGDAPKAMARACAALSIPMVHISTDYVFDGGDGAPFAPDHATAPLGAYGRSKLAGEVGVRTELPGNHIILRTSWVFSAHGANFLKTMLRLGSERDSLTVVADQIGGPTPASAIAEACLTCVAKLNEDPGLSGTYHLSGAPDVSWADFARAIMAKAGLTCRIDDIPSSDYPTPARRPADSRMDCATLTQLGLTRPDWRQGMAAVIAELGESA
ncbi:dTDP-4-dehydrorhamnose reductase [Roseovarius sp. Pro17]|uniref:dTDP-4-dehydrorhamnose reductase n=1 Tax=Roseovarius sp. Pro17 TaxID=3108175 RepID=UPI002D794030|nr:dTDP-4-dehydrorhamnose reductase [Roseovarius sp. Pro17]